MLSSQLKNNPILNYFFTESNERECTTGFLKDITNTGGEPVPLPSRNRPNLDFVQWLFPFMSFTCEAKITRWQLRIEQIDLDFEEGDRRNLPQISIWRPRQAQGFPSTAGISYELAGITNETLSTVINQGSIFEYRLSTPMTVEPGHIVGIQMPLNMRERLSRSTKLLFWQLTNGNASYLSYSSLQNRTTIVVSPFEIIEPIVTFIPLIAVHIGEFYRIALCMITVSRASALSQVNAYASHFVGSM